MTPSRFANFRSPAALAALLVPAILGVAADLYTKYYAFAHLAAPDGTPQREHQFIPGWLHFNVTVNHGAVFGIGAGQRALFIAVSVIAIGFLLYLFASSGRQRGYQIIMGMLMAGVIGNLYDRARYGHVRDMIHALPQWPDLFPWIFNVADVLLCCGVALVFIHHFIAPAPSSATAATADAART